MEDLKALMEKPECCWGYIDELRMALAATCKERDELKKENAALHQIAEKQTYMNQRVAELALQLDTARGERDVVTKHMIELESSNGQVSKALRENGFDSFEELLSAYNQVKKELHDTKSELDAAFNYLRMVCDACVHVDTIADCDCECLTCQQDCPCRDCRDGSNFEYRGPQKEAALAEKGGAE